MNEQANGYIEAWEIFLNPLSKTKCISDRISYSTFAANSKYVCNTTISIAKKIKFSRTPKRFYNYTDRLLLHAKKKIVKRPVASKIMCLCITF